jgi:hypothetical protein
LIGIDAAGEPNLAYPVVQKTGGIKVVTCGIPEGFQIYERENSIIHAVNTHGQIKKPVFFAVHIEPGSVEC